MSNEWQELKNKMVIRRLQQLSKQLFDPEQLYTVDAQKIKKNNV